MRIAIPFFLLLWIAAPAQAAAPIAGNWVTQDGKGVVTIAACGHALCGHITRLLPASKGAPTNDARNPDPVLRKRSMLGLPVLTGFVDHGSDWKGEIYSPEEGKTYRAFLTHNADGSLTVRGCWYFLCRNLVWRAAG